MCSVARCRAEIAAIEAQAAGFGHPSRTFDVRSCGGGLALDHSVLPIQGPPGAGKTFTGARMICELVNCGKKVGITAVGHKVIRKLLDGVLEAAHEMNVAGVTCAHRMEGDGSGTGPVREIGTNDEALRDLQRGAIKVLGGTPWLWSRADLMESVDVLFVDEAGQMSLANVLACAPAGRSLVLLGDPQQLEQPQKGSHPEGSDISALAHLLDGRPARATTIWLSPVCPSNRENTNSLPSGENDGGLFRPEATSAGTPPFTGILYRVPTSQSGPCTKYTCSPSGDTANKAVCDLAAYDAQWFQFGRAARWRAMRVLNPAMIVAGRRVILSWHSYQQGLADHRSEAVQHIDKA